MLNGKLNETEIIITKQMIPCN